MNCYRCGKVMREGKTSLAGEYAGEKFEVPTQTMVCAACGYTTLHAGQLDAFRTKLADLYREKHGLLTSQQIREIRTQLQMTQEEFANYLKVGLASVKRWELGQAQDKSNDELIRLKCSLPRAEENVVEVLFRQGGEADEFSGGRSFSFEKLANVMLFFLEKAQEVPCTLGPLHINKLCWYADAEHFRRYGVSITGSRYARLPWGPALDDYRVIFRELQGRGIIEAKGVDVLRPRQPFNRDELSPEELRSLERVWDRFKSRLDKIVGNSHAEKAWKHTKHADLISFNAALLSA